MDLEQIFLSIIFKNLSCHQKFHTLSMHNVTQNTASSPTECNDVLNICQNMLHAVTGVTVVVFSRINLQQIDHVLNDQKSHIQDEFEDTKGGIRNLYWRRTDNTMAKRKSAKGQTTPPDDSFIHPRSLQDRFLSATNSSNVVQGTRLSRETNRRRLHNANI